MANRFRDQLRTAREAASQSAEVMALLLNIDEAGYQALEEGAHPPEEELLKRICVLLEWNFYDTRQLLINELSVAKAPSANAPEHPVPDAGQPTPAAATRAPGRRRGFHELLAEEREAAEQSPAVMALLLNIEEAEYLALEHGEAAPDDETLRRICVMLEWNYYDARQLLINDMAAQRRPPPPLTPARSVPKGMRDTLANRLKVVREETQQSLDVLAMLLNISVEHYVALEAGASPSDEQLRRISILYNWNYQDLIALQRSEHAGTLSPRRLGTPFPGASANLSRLRTLSQELERGFGTAPTALQQTVLAQLELIKQTLDSQTTLSRPGTEQGSLQPRA